MEAGGGGRKLKTGGAGPTGKEVSLDQAHPVYGYFHKQISCHSYSNTEKGKDSNLLSLSLVGLKFCLSSCVEVKE